MTSTMLSTKSNRRRAECDVQLLANRLAHLRAEELKARKKIDETKKRAKEIRNLKTENYKSQLDKQRSKMLESGASSDEVRRIQLNRSQTTQKRREKLKQKQRERMVDVKRMKEIKKENLDRIQKIKEEEKARKQKQKLLVKERERKLQEAKRARQRKLEEAHFRRYLEKIQDEQSKMEDAERRIEQMEKEEMALIQRLRQTQDKQRNAYEDLETALGEEFPAVELRYVF